MKFTDIGAPRGARRNTKRRGRGSGSGHGKTSCRGRKGAKKRSGRTTRPGFEGGQMPLLRRLPKRGFNSLFRNAYEVVNVGSLNRFENNSTVGPEEFKKAGLIGSDQALVKILGDGKLEKPLTVKAHRFSKSAINALTGSGAKAEYIASSQIKPQLPPKPKQVRPAIKQDAEKPKEIVKKPKDKKDA